MPVDCCVGIMEDQAANSTHPDVSNQDQTAAKDDVKQEIKGESKPESEAEDAGQAAPTVEDEAAVKTEDAEKADGEEQAPSDEDIVTKLREFLSADDLDFQQVTERQLRQQLEQHFNTSLKDRKAVVKAEVLSWIENLPKEEGAEPEAEDDDEDAPAAKRRGGGLNAPCQLSEPLQAFVGVETMARPQVVKAVWAYIRENELQNPADKRKFVLDDKLKTIFTAPVDMFSMNKQLSKHIYAPEPRSQAARGATPGKRKAESARKPSAKKARKSAGAEGGSGRKNGFQTPIQVSDELAEFLGGKKEISRPEITKFFWAYFKENDLLDPSDKRRVIADQKLKDLFGEDKFLAFSIQRLIKPHVLTAKGTVKAEDDTKSKKIIKESVKAEEDVEVSDMEE